MSAPYNSDLTSLTYFRLANGFSTANTDDDALIRRYITAASVWFTGYTQRSFVPYTATRTYDAMGMHISSRWLDVDDDLLAVITLSNGDGTTIASTEYVLEDTNLYPKRRIRLKRNSSVAWTYSTDYEQAISVTGIWGYHDYYPSAYTSRDTLNGAINASVTTLTLTTGTNVDDGCYALIDSEQVFITGTGTARTIIRGVNGTTAASHLTLAPVSVVNITPDVQWAVNELTKFMYETRDNTMGRIQAADGVQTLEAYIPPFILHKAMHYSRRDIFA